jgi:hypothetical protein
MRPKNTPRQITDAFANFDVFGSWFWSVFVSFIADTPFISYPLHKDGRNGFSHFLHLTVKRDTLQHFGLYGLMLCGIVCSCKMRSVGI